MSAPDNWAVKYLRESPFLSFGTMLQSYARINQGKGISVDELQTVADKLFEKAMELTRRAYESTLIESDDSVDIPVKSQ